MLLQRPIRKSSSRVDPSINDQKNLETPKSIFNIFRQNNNNQLKIPSGGTDASTNYHWLNNNEPISQRILCYRKTNDDLSLLEKIMREPGSSEFIAFVWSECEFWRDAHAIHAVNAKSMNVVDYVVESNDDMNLFTFLIHDLRERNCGDFVVDKNYFLKIKSDYYGKKAGMSIFNKLYSKMISDDKNVGNCLIILNEILKEMREVADIRREVKIDTILAMPRGEIQDDLLRILIKYWKVNSKDYHYYRNAFCEISPFYKLFLSLRENDEDDFEDTFPEYLDYIRQSLAPGENFNAKLQENSNILLKIALDTGMRKAMQILISCHSIDTQKQQKGSFDSINNEYAMLKLLEKGYYLGYEDEQMASEKDTNWFNAKIFEQFLDSRVTMAPANGVNRDDIRGVQIDYSFLISPDIRPISMKNHRDKNGDLMFSNGMRPLEWILGSDKLRNLITHPVLSTFINLKSHKFSQIYNLNLYMFCLCYVFPFMLTFVHYDPQVSCEKVFKIKLQ